MSDGGYHPSVGHGQDTPHQTSEPGRQLTTIGRAPTRRMAPGANSIANAHQNIQRGRTLIRPDRYQEPPPLLTGKPTANQSLFDPWVLFSRVVTFWAVTPVLKAFNMPDKSMQQAWREKMALCFIIACMGFFVAFITIGLSSVMCPPDQAKDVENYAAFNDTRDNGSLLGVLGWQFNISNVKNKGHVPFEALAAVSGTDITNYFARGTTTTACQNVGPVASTFKAITLDPCADHDDCPLGPLAPSTFKDLRLVNVTRMVGYDWSQLVAPQLANYFVLDGTVLNLDPYIRAYPRPIQNDTLDRVIRDILGQPYSQGGRDGTKQFFRRPELQASINCLVEKYRAGYIDKTTPGCFAASLILFCSLTIVLAIVLARFLMALIFAWFLSWRLSKTPPPVSGTSEKDQTMAYSGVTPVPLQHVDSATAIHCPELRQSIRIGDALYTVMLITCYSEGLDGIRATVESLARTDYPDDRKLLFLVADGMITGSGEKMSTPDICLSLITIDNPDMKHAEPMPYIAVADGAKQYNRAQVYAGHYVCNGHKVPVVLVVKCGNPDEQGKPKAGNRGKRDSQLILMNFFSRVTYNDRMTPLDYELFRKVHLLTGVTPDYFELVLMVDADTKVYPTSLRLLVNCMVNDNLIMGLCGETKIANKRGSWVSAIQVYEYFISHHLAKGFESVFGGVTCLPGCFCMYRLKARKGDGGWVPIITKPEIVQEYSQSTVETLHQKNLLLLGEDRFLTTLMLRNFPHRKMVFTPHAICKTVVPDEFKVLLSQRRRWINSTIHNLFELVLVRNLCGTFCFSMQFVVMMDLIGTLTLPVAIVLTAVLIISMAKTSITSLSMAIPLILLIIVLFSPAFLILITTRKWVYLGWMVVYLCALPIWNFVLPVYSFWHFDDFSWGETRRVSGETKGDHHGRKDGVFDPSKVPMRRWEDYERRRIRSARRREQKLRELGPVHLPHTLSEENGMSVPPKSFLSGDDETVSNNTTASSSDLSPGVGMPFHYFDPSKEAPGRAMSGYYPSFRPHQACPSPPPHVLKPVVPWTPTQISQQPPLPPPPKSSHQQQLPPQRPNTPSLRLMPSVEGLEPATASGYRQLQRPLPPNPTAARPHHDSSCPQQRSRQPGPCQSRPV